MSNNLPSGKVSTATNNPFISTDPFPDILPALLNSADIEGYVSATQMLIPFDKSKLKPGSYEIPIGGEVTIWNSDGKKEKFNLEKEGDKFVLPSNSIAYVWLDTVFRLPNYIALRFNLKITQVHRGILLGTGPLVDPGFEGRLFIPLHNLTNNAYEFQFGDGLIWAEFTKLSHHQSWRNNSENLDLPSPSGEYRIFPDRKKFMEPNKYLEQANSGNPIQSSIPIAINKANKLAEDAKSSIQKAETAATSAEARVRSVSNMMALFGFFTLAGVIFSAWAIFWGTQNFVTNNVDKLISGKTEILSERIKSLETQIEQIKSEKATNTKHDSKGK